MAALASLLISPLTWMWKAFVLLKLWVWFLVPLGAPRGGFVAAMGVVLIVGLLTPTKIDDEEYDTNRAVKAIGFGIIAPLIALGFGWGLHLFTA